MKRQCSNEGCNNDYYSKDLCRKCYMKARRLNKSGEKCCVDGCDRVVHAKNLCKKHYLRMYRTGTVNTRRKNEIPEDYCPSIIHEYNKTKEMYNNVIGVENRIRLRRKLRSIEKIANKNGIELGIGA
jgi:hypothetical protein